MIYYKKSYICECFVNLTVIDFEKMDIENLIAVFERKLTLQRYSAGSFKNYSSSERSFLQVAEKRFDQPDELNEHEIEKIRLPENKDNISYSYQRFAKVLFCAWTVYFSFSFFM